MSDDDERNRKSESGLLASIHKTASGLHTAGLVDKATMREFDALCLTKIRPLKSEAGYDAALAEIEQYFNNQPEPSTFEADRFDLLCRATINMRTQRQSG